MKTMLKIVLLLVAVVIAVKLLPVTVALFCVLAAALISVTVLGVSAAAVLLGATIGITVLLAPLWLPALVVTGGILLVRRVVRAQA